MRISDWSSDVCSSDLLRARRARAGGAGADPQPCPAAVRGAAGVRAHPLRRGGQAVAGSRFLTHAQGFMTNHNVTIVFEDGRSVAIEAAEDRKSTRLNSSH